MSELALRLAWERFVAPTGVGVASEVSGLSGVSRVSRVSSVASVFEVFDSVIARHREAHRHYHTLDHVGWVIRHLGSFDRDDIDQPIATAAAFYHDAIYDPTRHDNETKSATLAVNALARLGWAEGRRNQVREIIEATAHHLPSTDITTAAVCTADLAILAAEPVEYQDYVTQVRQEYGHLDEAAWREGRAAVLHSFLDREAIFDPRIAPSDWELRARANIESELVALES